MADVYEKKQGQHLTAGDVAYRNADGQITADAADTRIGVVAVDAAAEDASVMVEADPA